MPHHHQLEMLVCFYLQYVSLLFGDRRGGSNLSRTDSSIDFIGFFYTLKWIIESFLKVHYNLNSV